MTGPVSYVIPEDPDLPYALGRHVHHDERSRQFAFTADDTVLVSVTWPRAVPIFDQGNLGSCTGNAAAGWLATANALRPGLARFGTSSVLDSSGRADGYLGPVDEQCALFLYEQATAIDPFDGAYPPDDTGSDGLSVTKVLQHFGAVDSYQHAFDAQAALAALMQGPVMVGTVWYDGMFEPDSHGLVTVSGKVVGGHEYLLVGYDSLRQEVEFANSWSAGWGDAGHGRMSVDTLTRLLSEDGDATIPHALVAAPDPTPPAAPAPAETFLPDLPDWARTRMQSRVKKSGLSEEQWVTHRIEAYVR